MRVPRRALAFVAAVLLAALIVPAALAASVKELVLLAESYKMDCIASAAQVDCSAAPWTAIIKPASGPEDSLETASREPPRLDGASANWMIDMHQAACSDPKGVDAFVTAVGLLDDSSKDKDLGPVAIGNCRFTGAYIPNPLGIPSYRVHSAVLPPPPTPTPTPTPTANPTSTPAPTSAPSAAPATAAPSLVPGASASPGPSPSAGPSATASLSPATGPTPTPPAVVPPEATGPAPTGPPPSRGGGGGAPGPSLPTFEQSVLGISDVNTDGGAVGGSLLLALLLLLIVGFAGELFNNTVEQNYAEISGWFRKGPLGWLRRVGDRLRADARAGLLGFLALTALISSFVDPHFGLDLRSLGVFLGFLAGLVVVLASFKLPMMFAHRRTTGDLGRLRPLPWALVIAALFVLVSRLGDLQPGYLYGIVLGAVFVRAVPREEEGRETFYGSLWTLGAAVLGWLGLTWVRSLGYDPAGFGVALLSTAFAAILVAGLEATAFGLMPLRFMPGHSVYRWNRLAWGLLFGLAVFAFIHLLISPASGYVSNLSPQAFIAACGVFAAFGGLSIATWAYFRFRPKPAPA